MILRGYLDFELYKCHNQIPGPIKVVLLIIIVLSVVYNYMYNLPLTRVVAILDFDNMAAPGVICIGARQKSKRYDRIWATYTCIPNMVLVEKS